MRQIVPARIWEQLARDYGNEAVCDQELYSEIFATHYVDAFASFCERKGLRKLVFPPADNAFDVTAYLEQQRAKREALNQFIRQKPYVVVTRERFFVIEFLSEVELRIDELSADEVADLANQALRERGFVSALKSWLHAIVK